MESSADNGDALAQAYEELDELSLAEWEYAWRYTDHVSLGERRPDASGFDAERVKLIERKIDAAWYVRRQRLNRRAR